MAAGGVSQLTVNAGFGGASVHVVCTYDPVRQIQAIYTNGILQSVKSSGLVPLSNVSTNGGSLGRSPWYAYGDPYMSGSLDEFRIWNGALNPLEIAASEAAGPGTANTNYGTVTNLQLQVAFQMTQNTLQQAVVIASATGLALHPDIATMCSFASGNTNILTVTSSGTITAVAQGATTITASFGGISNAQTITVVPPTATLGHRYIFTSDASDSVGGVTFDGTLNGTATISGNQVVLDGTSGTYVGLPTGILSNWATVTFECWLTNSATPDNVCSFEFSGGTGTGGSYLRHVIHDNGNNRNQFEMTAGGNSNLQGARGFGDRTMHILCIYDPAAHVQAVFTNGALHSVKTGSSIPTLSNLSGVGGALGRSPWWAFGDPYLNGSIDEFRIYSGELTPQRIAMNYAAGPNSYATDSEGSLVSIALQVAATMPMSSSQTYGLLVNYTGLSNFDIINNSIFPVAGLSVTSSDTNIVSIGANKLLTAGIPGTATLTAIYQGKTNSATVTVLHPPLAPLTHRWSFNETSGATAVDSVGGADGTLQGTATFDASGNVILDGTSGCYVSLPVGVLTNLTAVTFETWLTNGTSPDNVCQFEFSGGGGTGGSYLRHVIHDQSNGRHQFEMTAGGNSNLQGNPGMGGQYVHVVCVYDPTTLVQQVFTNGVLASSKTGSSIPAVNNLWTFGGVLGRSPWWAFGDPYMAGAINEFRIYAGRLLPDEIAATEMVGPGAVLTTSVALSVNSGGGSLTLSWPVAAAGFTLESSPVLGTGAVWTPIADTIVGANHQAVVAASAPSRFYRLRR